MPMKNAYVVAVIAGLAAAALQAAVMTPSLIGILLFILAPLPLFMTGFAFGPLPAAAGGLVGALVLTGLINWQIGFVFAVSAAIAPVFLTWLALKHRQSAGTPSREGEASLAGAQWYPEGRLVLWAAGLAVAVMLATFLAGGGDLVALRAATAGVARRIGEILAQNDPARLAEIDAFVQVMVALVPPAATIIWHLATMICLWLAARIVTVSKLGLRPWAPFASLRFPFASLWGLGGAGLVMMVSGLAGPAGSSGGFFALAGFAGSLALGAMTSAFMLLGLAVVHGLTTGLAGRGLILASLYLALVLLQGILLAPLVALAIADMVFDLRGRSGGPAPPART
jgi:hypothetical protein